MQTVFKSLSNIPKFAFSNQLSAQALQQIKNSVPVIQAKGQEITEHFYNEVVYPKNLPFFNKQFAGGRQSLTLSQFLVILSERAENLEKMQHHFERISSKHAGFGLTPEHYPLFTEGIVNSIKAVLGQKASPAMVSAWTELLAVVAKGLQENEAEIYTAHQNTVGSWIGTRSFTLDKVEPQEQDYFTLYFKATDGKPIATFKPGQYVTINAKLPNGTEEYRHLVICNSPGRNYYRVTVQASKGPVSEWLSTRKVGDKVDLLAPSGKFCLQGHFNDVVLIGTGHANVSLFQIANAAKNRNVYYIQVCKNEQDYVLRKAVEQLAKENPRFKHTALFTDYQELGYDFITKFAPIKNADYYFCSSNPEFADNVHRTLKVCGVEHKNCFYEFEGPYQFLHQ